MEQTKQFTSKNNITFTVRFVKHGDKYGRNMCLTHDKQDPLIEFYDSRYNHTEYGQFISRYYLTTLDKPQNNIGLCLDFAVKDWSIDAECLNQIKSWINSFPVLENKSILEQNIKHTNIKRKIYF